MALTFLEIAQAMADELDFTRPTTIETVSSAEYRRIKFNINRAYNKVRLKANKKDENQETTGTITTAASTEAYNFPTGMLNIYALIGGADTAPMEIIPWIEYQAYKADTFAIIQTGSPEKAAIYNRQIYFYPVPDTVYTINVYGQENFTPLSLDTDEPDLPDAFHYAVYELALYFQMHYEGNPAAAQQQQIALDTLDDIKANMKASWTQPPRMRTGYELERTSYSRRITR